MPPDRETPRWTAPQTPRQPGVSPRISRTRLRWRLGMGEDPSGSRLFWLITGTVALTVAGLWTLLSALAGDPPSRRAAAGEPPGPAAPKLAAAAEDAGFSPGARRRRQAVFTLLDGLEGPFSRLGQPQPGDWLYSFREPGQTIEEYLQQVQNRRSPARQTLHLLPFADLSPKQQALLPTLQTFITTYFGIKTARLPTRPLDRWWRNPARNQVDAAPVLEALAAQVPPQSLGLIGLLRADLYLGDLNFVFGAALLHERASVQSLSRFFVGHDNGGLDRVFKLLAHEVGHMFGLKHCVFYRCLMNGTNSMAETDQAPLHLCPICLAKLQHNLEFDPQQRYRQLAGFYREQGLEDEASFVSRLAGAP